MISAGAALALRFVRPPDVFAGDDPEFSRILRIADPSPALENGGAFLPPAGLCAADWVTKWEQWRDSVFTEHLAPALETAAIHAAAGEACEIRDLDLALSAVLSASDATRSAAAGQIVFQSMSGVRGERWLNKLQGWAGEGAMPAHFAVAYACRYASFHLSSRLLLPTYAYWEWTAAANLRPPKTGDLPEFAEVAPANGSVAMGADRRAAGNDQT